ncbi:MAG: C-GCAxxG-C-C family (seleno)protein [Merdibacter sp.]
MLKEKAELYYLSGYNCAECMLHAANDVYALGLDEHAMRLAAGFGGGMQVGEVCGALTGAICAIASRYVETKAHDTPH